MHKNLLHLLYLSAIIYFIQGFESIPGSSIFFYFKETLHLSESTIMYIGSITGLAWLIKPVLGYYIDQLGLSKKLWMLLATVASIAVCLILGLVQDVSLILLIILLTLSSSGAAIRDVANDGMMCEVGKRFDATGKIQSVQWIAITVASILTGVGGGWIAEHSDYHFGYLLLLPFYAVLAYIVFRYRSTPVDSLKCDKCQEPYISDFRVTSEPRYERFSFIQTCKKLIADKNLLWVCLFIFLYNFAPSFGTPLSFIQRDEFHWSKQWMGTLGTIGAVFSIVGALVYYKFSKLIDIKKGLTISVYIGSLTTLAYLYFTPISCVVYDVIFAVIGMFIQLMMLDFVARSTKVRMEAISFALFCSVINLASTCDNLVGAWLFPIVGIKWLIIIAAITSFACLPILNKIKFK